MDELVSGKEAILNHMMDQKETKLYKDLSLDFGFVRRVKGDGNCFYRALCFRVLETLLHSKSALQRFTDKLGDSNRELISAGFDEDSFLYELSCFLGVLNQLAKEDCEERLLKLFNDQDTSDSMVKYLRLLTSARLRNNAEFFKNFVEGPSLEDYCTEEVERMDMECDHVGILALSEALDIHLCIVALDVHNSNITYHFFPEGTQPSLYLLYKMSHYDVLHKYRED